MRTVSLYSLPCFSDSDIIEELNRIGSGQATLMPHVLAIQTGCALEEATALLLLLLRLSIVEGLLLVYHNAHIEDPPIIARDLLDGLPDVPLVCDICQEKVFNRGDLSYDFMFRLKESVQFTFKHNALL